VEVGHDQELALEPLVIEEDACCRSSSGMKVEEWGIWNRITEWASFFAKIVT
jgi:hypothetical protein